MDEFQVQKFETAQVDGIGGNLYGREKKEKHMKRAKIWMMMKKDEDPKC